jgi:hypothetical protein
LNYLPKYFTSKAIAAYFVILGACYIFFAGRGLPLIWITFGSAEVITFFYFSNLLTHNWAPISDRTFRKELFTTALVIRILYVVFVYFFYELMTETPHEFDAADALIYHNQAVGIVEKLTIGDLNFLNSMFSNGVSDSGFPIWLSVIYFFTSNSILAARIVNALIGSWMCILIYKLARRNFGEGTARISAVLAMLLPTFIYYCGIHNKETVMTFLLVAFAERADYFLRLRTFKTWNLLSVLVLGSSLFFFRTVLAAAAWFALFSALLLSAERLIGPARKTIYILWFTIASSVVISGSILTEVQGYLKDRTTNQQMQMKGYSSGKGANTLSRYGSSAVFMPIILFAPFPTLVNIETQKNIMMINGNMFTRNVFAFFVIIALLRLIKNKNFNLHILILTVLLSYLAILALSGFALSERFHMPAVPFLLIFAGYGITQMDNRNVKFYIPYLVFIGIVIIGWNWFKLAGRGIGF